MRASCNVDYTNDEDWPKIRKNHVKMLKELAEFIYYPYEQEIKNLPI